MEMKYIHHPSHPYSSDPPPAITHTTLRPAYEAYVEERKIRDVVLFGTVAWIVSSSP